MLDGCTPWPQDFVRRYIKEGVWDLQSIPDLLDESARAHAERRLVADGSRQFTYQEVNALADRLAFHLLDRGFKPRDIVLLQLPNIWEFVVVFFALQKIGVVPVMCLPPHRHTELTYFAQLTAARGYFFSPRFRNFDYLAMAREIQSAVPSLDYLIAAGDGSEAGVSYLTPWLEEPPKAADLAHSLAPFRPAAFDVAFFLLSGGTTGVPKLIPRTHADYIYNARQCAQVLG